MMGFSIRQPWAWLIVNGFKDIENRDWSTGRRGRFLVHAGKGMTRDEYDGCLDTIDYTERTDIVLPAFEALERGGIVGSAVIVDYHVATFSVTKDVQEQMRAVAFDCYVQGLLDGAQVAPMVTSDGRAKP